MHITYELFQTMIVYPPRPGDPGGPCEPRCSGHIGCEQMYHEAAKLCPTCQQPLGFGAIQHLNPIIAGYPGKDTGFRKVSGEHESCYQARLERERLEAIAQTDALAAATKADAEAARVAEQAP